MSVGDITRRVVVWSLSSISPGYGCGQYYRIGLYNGVVQSLYILQVGVRKRRYKLVADFPISCTGTRDGDSQVRSVFVGQVFLFIDSDERAATGTVV